MSETPGANYSGLDRLLHKWAFSGIEIQKSLADIEDRMHAARIASVALERPVFITSIARAGTTLLLDLVTHAPGFVTHTYRCMPFVLCPILWDSVSRGFRRQSEARERAHGDGMTVGYDSPEAFEEVLWKAFWPEKYAGERIPLWRATERSKEFELFFRNHIRKLIAMNAAPGQSGLRYVSKNNANIARIELLRRIFPDAVFLVPFREPVDQAASLMRQHKRFLEIHAGDTFTRRYMEGLGHHEFGAGMRLLDFPALSGDATHADPMKADFWLAYWNRAYGHLLSLERDGLHFVDFDALCINPRQGIAAILRTLEVADTGVVDSQASKFHAPVRYDAAKLDLDPQLLERARGLYGNLLARAIR